MRKVNLFIVGAAKSATTSLYNFLSHHPDVFFPQLKEPRYFSSRYYSLPHSGNMDFELTDNLIMSSFDDYQRLYKGAHGKKILGDASVDYLYTYQTANDIFEYNPEAKIIIILRNPYKRAFSHYSHLVRDKRETLSFKEALALETSRIKENYEFSWHYVNVGLYAKQVKAFKEVFGNQVLVVLFEDLISDSSFNCKLIANFLQLDYKFLEDIDFPLINKSGIPKSQYFSDFLSRPSSIKNLVKLVMPYSIGGRIKGFLNRITLNDLDVDINDFQSVKHVIESDIIELEKILDKQLLVKWKCD